MQKLKFPKEITLKPSAVGYISRQFEKANSSSDEHVHFDFSKTDWINAELSVLIGVLLHHLFENKKKITGTPQHKKVRDALAKNGFLKEYKLINENSPDMLNNTIPYKVFKSNDEEAIYKYLSVDVYNRIKEHLRDNDQRLFDEKFEQLIDNIFELVHNITEHSESSDLFICGQYYFNENKLSIAIADSGITIPNKFKESYHDIKHNDSEIINNATSQGISTKKSEASGLGLFTLKESVNGLGSLKILSNRGLATYQGEKNDKLTELEHPFNGTLVRISIKI